MGTWYGWKGVEGKVGKEGFKRGNGHCWLGGRRGGKYGRDKTLARREGGAQGTRGDVSGVGMKRGVARR